MPLFIVIIFLFNVHIYANGLKKVSLQLQWKYQYEFAGFIMAKEKGFYEDKNLDVQIRESDENIDVIKEVIDKKADFGVINSSIIYYALKKEPVVGLMAVFQQSPYILMGLKNSSIKELKDIENKNIALINDYEAINIQALLKSIKVKYNKKILPIYSLDLLLNKEVDLISAYISNEPFVAKERGVDTTVFNPENYGFETYGNILFTSKEFLRKNRVAVTKMNEATKKGWNYAFSHINETIDIIYNKYNSLNKSKNALLFEAQTLKKISGYGINFGEIDKEKIRGIAQIYNFLEEEKYPLKNLDDFVFEKKVPKKIDILTKEELEYLRNKKIKVCVHSNFYPYEFIRNKIHYGVTADYIEEITKGYPFNFEVIKLNGKNDKDIIKNICDMKPTIISKYQLYSDFLDETINTVGGKLIMITTYDKPFIGNINMFKGKKFAVSHIVFKRFLEDKYPEINVTLIESDISIIIEKLKNEEIYGYIGATILANIVVEKFGADELKVNKELSEHLISASIGVSKKEPMLLNILNKLILNTPKNKFYELIAKWDIRGYQKVVNFKIIKNILLGTFIIFVIFLFWLLKYRKESIRRKKAEEKLYIINSTLAQNIEKEIEKNKQNELIMFQQSRQAQMGEMISMIAHQWRQPLNNLYITVQALGLKYKKGKLTDELMDKSMNLIKEYIFQMSKTIDTFSDFFKPQKEPSSFLIHQELNHILNILSPTFKNSNIKVDLDIEKSSTIFGFQNEFSQVFMNLLNNAKDALIENNEVNNRKIVVSLKEDKEKIVISIEDNGGGIDNEILNNIFDPYFSTKNERNGTGLGLYMCRIIIENHCKGKIIARNGKDGAIFEISLYYSICKNRDLK